MYQICVRSSRVPDVMCLGLMSENMMANIEYAGRLCYNSIDKMGSPSNERVYNFIKGRINSGHESVIEHGIVDVILTGNVKSHLSELMELETIIACSNTMLHYVNDSNEFLVDQDVFILSLSGNMHMWRDFLKYVERTRENIPQALIKYIIAFFIEMGKHTQNIFINDIPLLGQIDMSMFKIDPEIRNDPRDNWLTASIDRNVCNISADDKDELKTVGCKLMILNIDRVSWSMTFCPWLKDIIGGNQYILTFVRKHIKDLSSITYEIEMPRVITQQEARHRINSISQMSQRYVNESGTEKSNDFYFPERAMDCDKQYPITLPSGIETTMSYKDFCELSRQLYRKIQEDNTPNEVARFVLPNGIMSRMVVTKPFYTLDHYFHERCAAAAQAEIRVPAQILKKTINNFLNGNTEWGKEKLFE